MDDSDEEWDLDIQAEFGTRGGGFVREVNQELDRGLDMSGLVQHTFHM